MPRTEDPAGPGPLDAIILCGGRGTRLAGVVSDVPKPLAPVAGRPFLDHLLARLAASGVVGRAVLALGHLADRVIDHYRHQPAPLPLSWVVEDRPLGTGGALVQALTATASDPVLALNGDSLADLDLAALVAHHRATAAAATLALVRVADCGRYGRADLAGSRLVGFAEKAPQGGPGPINAGIYVLSRAALARPAGPCSFEQDLLPALIAGGRVETVTGSGAFIDIGLPETYAAAPAFIAALASAGRPSS